MSGTSKDRWKLFVICACALIVGLGGLVLLPMLSAQECNTDEDCANDYHCEVFGSSTGSSTSGGSSSGAPFDGECVRNPIPCADDSQCPDELSCVDFDGEGYCVFVFAGCTVASDDCAEHFRCVPCGDSFPPCQ